MNLNDKWSGNTTLQKSNSQYVEGDVIPFHSTIENDKAPILTEGQTYIIRLEWNFAAGTNDPNKHFFDYLTSYNATEAGIGDGVARRCFRSLEAVSLRVDPIDTELMAGVQQPGFFTLYNIGNISFVSQDPENPVDPYVEYEINNNETRKYIDIRYTPNDGDLVAGENLDVGIAWGGHLATQSVYGLGNGAGEFPGASTQFLIHLTPSVTGDSTNLNIMASAVVPAARITVVKDALPNALDDFTFTYTNVATGVATASRSTTIPGLRRQ